MKLLAVCIIVYLLLVGCASVKPVPIQDITNLEPVITAQTQTWCCCQADGGICCNWSRFCPWSIPGCYCK